MLTIQRPINIVNGKDIRMLPEKLNNTIGQNYNLLNENFRAEDLLFLLTTPAENIPEETSYNSTNIFNSQTTNNSAKFEIINNFVNRISTYGTEDFTYQDSVYISNVLNKLGITNVAEFMKEVKNIKENVENVSALIKVYSNNLTMLKEANYQYSTQDNKHYTNIEEHNLEKNSLYLQDNIYKRLQTSNIYEVVHNFSHPTQFFETDIFNDQMLVAEQVKVYNQLKLTNLKQEVGITNDNIFNSQENLYERHENVSSVDSKEKIIASGIAGALINLIGNVLVQKTEENLNKSTWINAEQSFYNVAENSIRRFQTVSETFNRSIYNNVANIEQINENYKDEIETIINQSKLSQSNYYNVNNNNDYHYAEEENLEESLTYIENQNVLEEVEQRLLEQTNVFNQIKKEITHKEESAKTIEQKNIIQHLNEINERNVRVTNEINQIQQKQTDVNITHVDNRKIMKAALQAMQEPEGAINEFFGDINVENKTQKLIHNISKLESMSDADKAIYEAIVNIQTNPQKAIEEGLIKPSSFGNLLTDLNKANENIELIKSADIKPATVREIQSEIHRSIPIIHKKVNDINEELVEEINRVQKNQQKVISEQVVENNVQMTKTEINNISQQVIEKTTKDISKTIDKTISNQLDSITNKVYSQIERRLQSERARRGY